MPSRAGCPDPGLIAAHAERRLGGDEAARLDAHLASCPDCAEEFAETVRFALEEGTETGVLPPSAPVPFLRRRAFRAVAVLAAAAGLVLGSWLVWRSRAPRPPEPLLAELSRAMGDKRFVEPRLTGGFRHAPLVVLRGERAQGLDAYPPAVLSAVARIRERAEADPSPRALGALGVTYLVSGDAGAAVEALESATAQAPDDPRLLSDLSAAYLVRASRLDEPADVPRALDAAEKAIALDNPPDEAWFNRALALERLHLVPIARKAWEEFLARDSSSGWAEEARRHLEALPQARQSSPEDDRARVPAALEEGQGAVDRLADEDPSLLRDYYQDDLLPAWAEAQLAGRGPGARALREQAALVGDALRRATGDGLLRDTARSLSVTSAGTLSPGLLREQALGLRAFVEANRLHGLQQPSCGLFRESRRRLEAGGSPFAVRVRYEIVNACLYPTEAEAALDQLRRIETVAAEERYAWLLARIRWLQGLLHAQRGELTASLERYARAGDGFRSTGDGEDEATMRVLVAQAFHLLGEDRRAWRERRAALALLDRLRTHSGRRRAFAEAAIACHDQGLLRAAVHFEGALVETATRWASPVAMSDALLTRSTTFQILGLGGLAARDTAAAREIIPRIGDGAQREQMEAEAAAAEGAVLADEQPERAALALEKALGYFERAAPVRAPAARRLLARALVARGLDEEAELQLDAGIRELEGQRLSVGEAALQASFFDQSAALFDDMVALQVDRRHDPGRALTFVERGRGRQLDESLADPRAGSEPGSRDAPAGMPLDVADLQRDLPDGVALVYLVSSPDRLMSWALTRNDSRFEEQALPQGELRRLVAAHEATLDRRASLPVVREASARLYDAMVRPLDPVLRSQRAIVVVPDDVVQPVAFAALWDRRTGRYLVEDHLLGTAPSGTVFVRASAAASASRRDAPPAALAVGNPRFDPETGAGLPDLPGAEKEATEVAALYAHAVLLSGGSATKLEFLDRLRESEVVHFAGHALTGDAPWSARLLFAPDPSRADSGAFYLHELDRRRCARTRVVVLAACRTAAGPVSRVEGAWSLARPFLASGVPSVVASLWDVDDVLSRGFFVAFHRALLSQGDALLALRGTQVAFLRGGDPSLAHPASWAGFVSMGGLDRRGLAQVRFPL